ncbi:MAG TPA: MBL fold metallo-hydrolase [Patescibacteria group bacterium]|nr:MBL fold metallo-hydrolase [Patescibacteria group bacterium]
MVEVLEGLHSINLSEGGGLSLECWLLDCPEGLVLVDTGMRDPALEKIEAELKGMGKSWRDIDVCLITHKHGDHVANLAKVVELSGCKVMAHKGDAGEIQDSRGVPVEGLEHKQVLPYCGVEVVHVPGHSAGNVSYYLPKQRALIAGDTIFGDDEGTLESPPERYCMDADQARREIKRLLDYDFDALLITHGKNTMKDAKEKVEKL